MSLPLRERDSLDDGVIIDVPAPNPVLRWLLDAITSPYTWGMVIAAHLVRNIVTAAPWQGWTVFAATVFAAWCCTRKNGLWRNPYPPADPGWNVRLIMIATYVGIVGGLLLWLT